MSTRWIIAAAVLASGVSAAQAQSGSPSLQDQRQAACYSDVQKLCGQFVPDVAKVTACMKPKKDVVSAKCRALWDVKG